MKKIKWMALVLAMLLVAGCSKPQSVRVDKEVFVLDTIVRFSIWTDETIDEMRANELLRESERLCFYYEKMLSKSIDSSDIYRLNHADGAKVAVSEKTAFLIEESMRYSELTDGYFDITVLPIKDLWDFKAEDPVIPTQEQIDEAVRKVGFKNIMLGEAAEYIDSEGEVQTGREAWLKNGATIELGGIAKGFIADEISAMLKEQGVKKGIINLGGNVLMIGEKEPGTPWKVGIQDPEGTPNDYMGTVSVVDRSVVTSGVYQRFFEKDGKIYHHLLDPFEGRPTDNGLASVTIFSPSSIDGDALSTSCFVLGLEKGLALAEKLEDVEAVFITTDGEIVQTSGMSKYDFTIE